MRKRMRRSTKIKLGCLVILSVIMCTSVSVKAWSTNALFDNNKKYNRAIINTFDGSITVDVKTWDDFEDGITIRIVTTDGTVYYTGVENVILIHEK